MENWVENVAEVDTFGWAVEASVTGGMEEEVGAFKDGDDKDWPDQETEVGAPKQGAWEPERREGLSTIWEEPKSATKCD